MERQGRGQGRLQVGLQDCSGNPPLHSPPPPSQTAPLCNLTLHLDIDLIVSVQIWDHPGRRDIDYIDCEEKCVARDNYHAMR